MVTAGAGCLALVGVSLIDAHRLEALVEDQLASRPSSTAGSPHSSQLPRPAPDEPIGMISAPRLGLSAVVLEGTGDGVLRRAVGHFSRTALPGEPGNVALAGHRDTFFRPLARVRVGDRITVSTPYGDYDYRVVKTWVVEPTATEVLDSNGDLPSLTLVTCYPFDHVGPAPRRFIVRAVAEPRPERGRKSLLGSR